jgi:hypothetical protein
VERDWYQHCTRPSVPSEYQPTLRALEARGYDVTVAKRMVWA